MTTRAFPARRVVSPAMRAARRRENIAAYLFMAPSLVFFLGFVIFPMGMCLVTSFFNYTMTDFSWIGLANYVEMFQDAIFGKALVNTIVIVLVSVPVTCMFSLWVASLIYKMRDRHTSFFRCVFYLPVVTGSVAVTVVWKWIFNNYYGVLNYVAKNLGLITRNINWLGDARYKVNWRETDEGESESIAEDSLFSPSPVSCADILPRWGKNRMVRRIRGVVRIRRTIFVYSPVYRRAGTSRRPYTETSGMPVGATLVVARPKLSPREAGTEERTIST